MNNCMKLCSLRSPRENSICVFPDETVRRSWIQQYTLKSEKGALLLNRILSWDTFIRNFQDVKDLKEADETVRFLFVKNLIEKNGSSLRFFLPERLSSAAE